MKSELCKETGSDYDVFTTRSFYSNNIVIFFVIYFIHLGQTLEWPLRTTTDTLKNDLPITRYYQLLLFQGQCKCREES